MNPLFSKSLAFKNIKDNLNALSHAYLFLSPDDMANALFVEEVSKLLLCDSKSGCEKSPTCLKISANSHPDILKYPKSKNFVVEDANDLNSHVYEKPMLSEKKIIIIENIDDATTQAQNKILKTLEEPPKSVVFLLTAKNENKLLPTIISRVRKTNLQPFSKEILTDYIADNHLCENPFLLESVINYGGGWIGKTLNALNNSLFKSEKETSEEIVNLFNSSKTLISVSSKILSYKDDIKSFLEILSKDFRQLLLKNNNEGILKIIQEINTANQNLDRNVNFSLIIDNLLMKILEYKYLYKIN